MSFDIEEILEINKFSHLHDGDRIFFCKTDYLNQAFPEIAKVPNDVILISGNSDLQITENQFLNKPNNVVKWFCQNKHVDEDILVPIPIGIENRTPCKIPGHGKVWGHAPIKHEIINSHANIAPEKVLYSNFTIDSRRHPARNIWMNIAETSEHITVDRNMQNPYGVWVENVLKHEAVLCPLGNSPGSPDSDNHRIYEVLYLNRIPVVHVKSSYNKLHHQFPVILIENLEDVGDESFMRQQIDKVKNKNMDKKFLNFSHWKNIILEAKESLK